MFHCWITLESEATSGSGSTFWFACEQPIVLIGTIEPLKSPDITVITSTVKLHRKTMEGFIADHGHQEGSRNSNGRAVVRGSRPVIEEWCEVHVERQRDPTLSEGAEF